MRELTGRFDHVVDGTPAASHGSDAGVIAGRCGVAAIFTHHQASRVAHLQELLGAMAGIAPRVARVVLNER